jgi:hypothetical protein
MIITIAATFESVTCSGVASGAFQDATKPLDVQAAKDRAMPASTIKLTNASDRKSLFFGSRAFEETSFFLMDSRILLSLGLCRNGISLTG